MHFLSQLCFRLVWNKVYIRDAEADAVGLANRVRLTAVPTTLKSFDWLSMKMH